MATEPGLTERLQQNRLTVVEVLKDAGLIRVREHGDACADLVCPERTVVVSDDAGPTADLGSLNPGDIVKIEDGEGRSRRILVLRRVWEEYTSPEV